MRRGRCNSSAGSAGPARRSAVCLQPLISAAVHTRGSPNGDALGGVDQPQRRLVHRAAPGRAGGRGRWAGAAQQMGAPGSHPPLLAAARGVPRRRTASDPAQQAPSPHLMDMSAALTSHTALASNQTSGISVSPYLQGRCVKGAIRGMVCPHCVCPGLQPGARQRRGAASHRTPQPQYSPGWLAAAPTTHPQEGAPPPVVLFGLANHQPIHLLRQLAQLLLAAGRRGVQAGLVSAVGQLGCAPWCVGRHGRTQRGALWRPLPAPAVWNPEPL